MVWPYNYHAHTRFGDGHSSAADYGPEAIRRGMRAIGISEHAPLGEDIDWAVHPGRVEEYRREVENLRDALAGRVEVMLGLEMDWWPARDEWYNRNEPARWDYLIGSVHYVAADGGTLAVDHSASAFEEDLREVFGGDARAACDAFFACERAAALSGRFHILGHCDLIKKFNKDGCFFDMTSAWYREMAASVIDAAAESGIIVEVNTAGIDKPVGEHYPAPWLVRHCVDRGVRLTLNADAHDAAEIQRHFDRAQPELMSLGVQELWRLGSDGWAPVRLADL